MYIYFTFFYNFKFILDFRGLFLCSYELNLLSPEINLSKSKSKHLKYVLFSGMTILMLFSSPAVGGELGIGAITG